VKFLVTRRTAGVVGAVAKSHSPVTLNSCRNTMKKDKTQKPQPQKKITLKDLKARKEIKGGIKLE